MSAPISPDDRAVGPPEHLHPLFLLNGLRGSIRRLGGAYALIAYFAATGRWTTAGITAVAFLIFIVARTFVHWSRFEFRVGTDEIRIDSGIFSRRHRSIPFDRIQDVDIVQGPLARLLGLAEVRFETGGGGGRRPEEGVLQTIALRRAEEIRALVRGRRSAAAETAPPSAEEHPPIYSMSLGRVLLAGVFNFSLAIFAALLGFTQTVGQPLGIDPFHESFWRSLLAASTPIEEFLLAHRFAGVAAGIVLLILVGLVTGIVRTVLSDYGFRLDGTGTGLRRRRGLLTKTDVTLPIRRVQAAVIASGPVRDEFGWSALLVQSLAQEEKGRSSHELAPLATDEEADAVLHEIGWRPISGPFAWNPVSNAYVWSFALALSPLLIVPIVLAAIAWPAAAVAFLAALLLLIGSRVLAWRRIGYVVDGDRLLMRSGWWRRRLAILPKARIQSIDLTENFVTRRFGIAMLQFGVAGGRAGTHIIPAIPSVAARALRGELLDSLA